MVGTLTTVVLIKYYLIKIFYMNKGFGTILLFLLVALFILWILLGGPNRTGLDNPKEQPYTEKSSDIIPTRDLAN